MFRQQVVSWWNEKLSENDTLQGSSQTFTTDEASVASADGANF